MTAENSIEQPPGIIEIQAGVEAAKVIDNAPLPTTSPVATTKAVLGEYTVKIEAESPSPPPIIAAAVSIESNHASINAESSTAVPSISTLEAATATFTPPATIENANPVAANNSSPATVAHPPNQANPSSEAAVITHTQPHSSTAVTTQSQQSVATSGSVAPAPIVKSQTVGASATTIIPQQTQSSSKPTSTNQPPQLQASLSKNTSDTSGEQVRQAQNSTISRATRGNSVSIRDTLQRSNSARRKEIEAELELELAEEDEAAEKNAEKARIEALDAKIKQFSSVETKASFLVALLQLNEQILTEISEKRAKDSEIKRLNKKLEITTLKYQKELIHKQKELEDNKETVSKLHHEITSIKFVNKEEENTLQTVLEGRKNLMERLKAMEEEISRKNQVFFIDIYTYYCSWTHN